jgi:predicted aspartyl protease
MAPAARFRFAIVVVALIAARPLTERAVAGSYQKDPLPAADELWSRGLFEEAEAIARGVIANRPEDGASRELIARALLSRGDGEGARRECEAALASASVTPKWHYTMGRAYARLGEFSAAAREFGIFVQMSSPADRGSPAQVAAAGDAELFRAMRRSPRAVVFEDDSVRRVKFQIVGGHLFVMASVNRGRPTPWMIDTGAERTAVTHQTAERSGVTVLLQGRRGEERLVALLDEFAFGGLTFHEVPALVRLQAFHTAPHLGGDAFSPLAFGLSMVIDYERAELLLSRRLPDDPQEWTLPMLFHGVPTVRATVGGRPIALVVDSGANATVFAPWAAVDPADLVLRRQLPMHVVDTRNRRDPGAVMIIPAPSIALGDVTLPATPVITMDLARPSQVLGFQIGGLLGHATLQTYRVTFDVARNRFGLSRRFSSS